MNAVTIETAATEEAKRLAEMWVRLANGQREHGSHLLPEANRTQIREAIVRHILGDSLLVAREDGIVGFVMFTVESGGYEQDTARGVVENLYVEPDYRGRGIGSRLLAAAEQGLADRGVDAIALDVMAANGRAREFYRDHGFEPHRVELEKRTESDTHSKGDE